MAYSHRNDLAKQLRALHIPGNPVLLTNCYDGATAKILVSNPSTKAVATASYAVAAAHGLADEDLTLEQNLASIRLVSRIVDQAGLPFTADVQEGYGDVAATIVKVVDAGAVGANIEDGDAERGQLRDLDDTVNKIRIAVKAAQDAGVPDFCINARTDTLHYGGSIEDVIQRGKAYLEAGALTVFVWGGRSGRGVSSDEVRQLVQAFDGMLNVMMKLDPEFLNAKDIAELGAARISIGPQLYLKAMASYRENLEEILAKRQ